LAAIRRASSCVISALGPYYAEAFSLGLHLNGKINSHPTPR
jgi:hypothetical protein